MLSAVYAVVGCLCVCVPVTLRYCIKTAKRRITQTTPHDSPMTLFLMPKIMAKFERDHPLRGRQMHVGWFKIGHFRRKTRYNSKTVQGRRIVSIKVESSLRYEITLARTSGLMLGRHYEQQSIYLVNFSVGNPQQSCPLQRESLNNISLTRRFPQYLFLFPGVTLTFC